VREKFSSYSYSNKGKKRVDHDQLFKQLIYYFFEEFLEVFFPDVHAHIDFSSIKPLSEEVYTDVIQGDARKLDIVIEAKLRGEESVLLIHVEPQSYEQKDFHKRMYHYFSLLYNKYKKPIVPIAVFSYDEKRNEPNEFDIAFPFFHVLHFRFLTLELKQKRWLDYIKSDNPAAAALLGKMGYKKEEKVQVKLEFLKMLVRMELDPAKSKFIHDFFEVYLKLDSKEEEKLMKDIRDLDGVKEFLELPNSWEERGIRKGVEKGMRQGVKKVALEMLKKGLPIELIEEVTELSRSEIEKL